MTTAIAQHKVVSEKEWLEARKALMAEEKALTRKHDEIARKRRELPWVKVTKNYVFDGPNGKIALADLFDGRSQLIVYHFMFGPEWQEGCPSCSFAMDHIGGALVHLAQRDVSFVAISRAPMSKIDAFKKRMGWQFRWVSSNANDFNRDYHVSFTKDELAKGDIYNFGTSGFPSEEGPGLSAFYKDESGQIFHTYSAYARGLDSIIGSYTYLDFAPKGRDEDSFSFPMAWIRHHDRYESGVLADKGKPYWPAENELPKAVQAVVDCCSEHKS